MGVYTLGFKDSAQKELNKLPNWTIQRIMDRLEALKENPYPNGHKKLRNFSISGYPGSWFYRIRIWTYRVIYTIENNQLNILVVKVAHRKDVYE